MTSLNLYIIVDARKLKEYEKQTRKEEVSLVYTFVCGSICLPHLSYHYRN